MEISDDDVVPIPEVIVRSVESSLVQFTLTFIYEPYIHWELVSLYQNRFLTLGAHARGLRYLVYNC